MKNTIMSALLIVALSASAVLTVTAMTPTRIRIARGKKSTTLSGAVVENGKTEYVVGAAKSQTMDVKVVSPCGGKVTLDVLYRENGKSLVDAASDTFHDTLTSAGDYLIRVKNSGSAKCKYKLKVAIE